MRLINIALILVISAFVAADAEESKGTFTFDVDTRDDSGILVNGSTWTYNSTTYTLTISGEGDMADFESASTLPWRDYRSHISVIKFKGAITSIG